MNKVFRVHWTEYERGWGQRPDGTSYHKTKKIAENFVDKVHGDRTGPVPDEYTKAGDIEEVKVSKKIFDQVQEKGSIWGHVTRWL